MKQMFIYHINIYYIASFSSSYNCSPINETANKDIIGNAWIIFVQFITSTTVNNVNESSLLDNWIDSKSFHCMRTISLVIVGVFQVFMMRKIIFLVQVKLSTVYWSLIFLQRLIIEVNEDSVCTCCVQFGPFNSQPSIIWMTSLLHLLEFSMDWSFFQESIVCWWHMI